MEAKHWGPGEVLISNGSVSSNHCRTLALLGAREGCDVHLVLHDEGHTSTARAMGLRILTALGASFEVVPSREISLHLERAQRRAEASASRVHVVPGGAHTAAAVEAYRRAALSTLAAVSPDVVVLASGTGATQAGLAMGAAQAGSPRVIGVSVARSHARGVAAIRECLEWFPDTHHVSIEFTDDFSDGGYGKTSSVTEATVARGWSAGLPLDTTYTGKAFRGLVEMAFRGEITSGSRVLFWHTGGLMNYLESLTSSRPALDDA